MAHGPNVRVPRSRNKMFSEVPSVSIPRSQIDRSRGRKTTFEADQLVPIFVEEILPGDTFTCSVKGFVRMFSPLKAPIMDNIYLDTHFFFVPTRLVWANWEKFNGEQDDPGDSTDYVIPMLSSDVAVTTGSIFDHFGIPVGLNFNATPISALPFRAYNLIFNQWFRDQNLSDSLAVNVTGTIEGAGTYELRKRAKKHDYFTSALPWPQKPSPQYPDGVTIPLGTQAPITGIGKSSQAYVDGPQSVYETDGTNPTYTNAADIGGFAGLFYAKGDASTGGYPEIYADLTNVTGVNINDLREAFQIQRLLEKDARGGTRYIEILHSHFGVTSPDARLQRSEYLGGGRSYINISPIAQTSSTDATTPQAHLTATATGVISGHSWAKSFVEHGYVIGLCSARADLTYQQGLNRMWSRETRFDFYWPSLARLGEQAILNKEIFVSNSATDDQVFGYQERYAEYRYAESEVVGKFRSDATGTLDLWHLAEDFASTPALNDTFIKSATPMSRIQAVTTEPDFIGDLYFQVKAARPMPLFGVPGMIDHF